MTRLPLHRNALCLASLLAAATLAAAEPSLHLAADRSQIYLGESFLLTLRVEGADQNIGEVSFLSPPSAAIQFLGSQSQSQRMIESINGRFSQRIVVARELAYRVTPEKGGLCVVGPVTLQVEGRPVRGEGPAVRVVGVEAQPFLRVEIAANRDAVLVDEPFEIVLRITAKRLAAPNEGIDPFHPEQPPFLDIPYLRAGEPLPRGLLGASADEVLRPLVMSRGNAPGFAVPFGADFFGRRTLSRIQLAREDATLDGAPAWRYTLTTTYRAEREGAYTFGPVEVKGQVITGVQPGGVPELRGILAIGPAATVRVVPPPEEGRPETFVGCLGTNLAVAARLDVQTCRQGDPLLLTLDLTGPVTYSNLRAPVLSLLPEVARSFRVYDDAVRTEAIPDTPLGRRFVYTVRPLVAGTIELPPIPVSYFDVASRTYRTVATEPVPLRVEAVAEFDPSSIVGPSTPTGEDALSTDGAGVDKPLAGITVAFDGVVAPPVWQPRLAFWLLPGPLLAGLALVVRWVARHRRRWAHERRRRRAAGRAARRLRRARTCGEAWHAVASFFEERFDVGRAGLSPLDASEALHTNGVPEETVDALQTMLQPLFDQSFRPGEPDRELLQRARHELPPLLARCGVRRRKSTAAVGITATLLLLLGATALRADDEQRFLWNQANARMATAATPTEFAEAAGLYRNLIDRGARTAPVFRNYGTALLLAEAPDAACDALLRAERHGGSSPDLRRNLELALAARLPRPEEGPVAKAAPEGLPWTRAPLFWHYQLPLRVRVDVLLALYNILWLAFLLRIARFRALARGLAVAGAVGLVLFGSSVLVSTQQDAVPLPEPVYRWQS